MPKSRDVALDIDKELRIESKIIGNYNYVQGYRKHKVEDYYSKEERHKKVPQSEIGIKYKGAGLGLKPAYEPIILIQKPIETSYTVAQNVIYNGVGVLNIENTRIPYDIGETEVGHNPHPLGRVAANIIRTEAFDDGYDKFFLVSKVRQKAENFNDHPTLKPVELMEHLVKLVSFNNQIILDPFMGSGSTGIACLNNNRSFIGFELDKHYFDIAGKRLNISEPKLF